MAQPSIISRSEHRLAMGYTEWLRWSDAHPSSEWVNGEAIIFMPPSIRHQQVVGFLYSLLSWYTRMRALGIVLVAPVEMRLSAQASREPDLLFVAAQHLDRLTPQRLVGAADLVVEVISDESVTRDRVEKRAEYAAAGVLEYLIVDGRPEQASTDLLRLTAEGIYTPQRPDGVGRLHLSTLPGLWLDSDWVRADPLPDPLTCLQAIAPDAVGAALGQTGPVTG